MKTNLITPEEELVWEEHLEELGNSIKDSVEILLDNEKKIPSNKKKWLAEMIKMKFIELLDSPFNH